MRIIAFLIANLSAFMLSMFAYDLRPGSFLGDAALLGVPVWSICTVLAIGLVVMAIDQISGRLRSIAK